jgi:hypothetical protein
MPPELVRIVCGKALIFPLFDPDLLLLKSLAFGVFPDFLVKPVFNSLGCCVLFDIDGYFSDK